MAGGTGVKVAMGTLRKVAEEAEVATLETVGKELDRIPTGKLTVVRVVEVGEDIRWVVVAWDCSGSARLVGPRIPATNVLEGRVAMGQIIGGTGRVRRIQGRSAQFEVRR